MHSPGSSLSSIACHIHSFDSLSTTSGVLCSCRTHYHGDWIPPLVLLGGSVASYCNTRCNVCNWKWIALQSVISIPRSMVCSKEGSCVRNYVGCKEYHRRSFTVCRSYLLGSIWFKHNFKSLDNYHGMHFNFASCWLVATIMIECTYIDTSLFRPFFHYRS